MIKFDLYDAVEELKSNRIISKDIDIANKTGYSRQIVSNYLTGKQKPSKAFINKFLDTFSMHLNTETPTKTNLGVQVYDVDFSAGNLSGLSKMFPSTCISLPK